MSWFNPFSWFADEEKIGYAQVREQALFNYNRFITVLLPEYRAGIDPSKLYYDEAEYEARWNSIVDALANEFGGMIPETYEDAEKYLDKQFAAMVDKNTYKSIKTSVTSVTEVLGKGVNTSIGLITVLPYVIVVLVVAIIVGNVKRLSIA